MFKVSGMTCGGCAGSVRRAIQTAVPSAQVKVDLRTGTVDVQGEHDPKQVTSAIEAAGFKVEKQAA